MPDCSCHYFVVLQNSSYLREVILALWSNDLYKLYLIDKMKRVLTSVCAALVVALVVVGCVEKKRTDVLGGEWSVVSIGELVVPDSVGAFLGFEVSEQLVYGFTGCNQLTGNLLSEVDASTPLFASLGGTLMMCADMTIEKALLSELPRVVDFNIDGDLLYLLDDTGVAVVALAKR